MRSHRSSSGGGRVWNSDAIVIAVNQARAIGLDSRVPFQEVGLREGAELFWNQIAVIPVAGLVPSFTAGGNPWLQMEATNPAISSE